MRCERCEEPAVLHVTDVRRSGELVEAHYCEPCARSHLAQADTRAQPYTTGTRPAYHSGEVQVEVERVIISEVHDQQVVIFREVDGERRLPFVLGIFEATTVHRTLKKLPSPRPLSHDAWLGTIAALGARLLAARIYHLQEYTYFAELRLDRNGELIRVDARPSDALTLALKAGAPFLIADQLLTEASGAAN